MLQSPIDTQLKKINFNLTNTNIAWLKYSRQTKINFDDKESLEKFFVTILILFRFILSLLLLVITTKWEQTIQKNYNS